MYETIFQITVQLESIMDILRMFAIILKTDESISNAFFLMTPMKLKEESRDVRMFL